MINFIKEQKKQFFKQHKVSFFLIAAVIVIVTSIFLSPAFSTSTSQCGSCHGTYYQYLDILEGNSANQLPTTLTVGETATISVTVENNVNAAIYNALSGVVLTLSSQNAHFTISSATYTVGTLQKGTAIATWKITGVSAGPDTFVITATAKNSHQSLSFQDTYSPAISAPTATPTSTTIQTIVPTQIPTSITALGPTTTVPTPTPTSTPIPTSNNAPSPTTAPSSTSVSSPRPTQTNTIATSAQKSAATPNANELSNNSYQQSALKIWFTNPTEGATITSGDKTIEWSTSGGSGNSNIKLEVSEFGSNGPWAIAAENLTSKNSFVLVVPNQQSDYIIRATASDSINPTQIASITVATKINSTIQPDTVAKISIITIMLLLTLMAVIILKRQILRNEKRKEQKIVSLNSQQNSLYPSFSLRLIDLKVLLGKII